jgi:hypothetical protein
MVLPERPLKIGPDWRVQCPGEKKSGSSRATPLRDSKQRDKNPNLLESSGLAKLLRSSIELDRLLSK